MENTTTNYEDYINKMYDSSLQSQKAQLEADYQQSQSDLDAEKAAAQKQADAALTRTYVEAAKSQKAQQEVQNAYGLTSGAMAQAKLAQDNQLQADLTTIRAAQQEVDAEAERQRSILSQQFMAAITQAQANNDLDRAQALYEAAQQADADLLTKQKEAASLMAGAGDFSLYQALYGLTDAQTAALKKTYSGGSTGGQDSTGSGVTALTDLITSGVQGLKTGIANAKDWVTNLFSGGTTSYGTDEESVRQFYIAQKQAGTPQRELDELLEAAIAAGLDRRDAAEIRDVRW